MSRYGGFDLYQMLTYLQKVNKKLSLDATEDSWCLSIIDNENRHTKYEGALFRIVKDAFKPFYEQAKADKEEKRKSIV